MASNPDGSLLKGSEMLKFSYGFFLAMGIAIVFGLIIYCDKSTRLIENYFLPVF